LIDYLTLPYGEGVLPPSTEASATIIYSFLAQCSFISF